MVQGVPGREHSEQKAWKVGTNEPSLRVRREIGAAAGTGGGKVP